MSCGYKALKTVYEFPKEYVRKPDVDKDVKEMRLQELKDQAAATEGEEVDELREELEERTSELTEFRSGRSFHESATGG